jgi:putative transposase
LKTNGCISSAPELAAQVFEDEYELAIAIIEGIKNRADQGQYQVERFMFN